MLKLRILTAVLLLPLVLAAILLASLNMFALVLGIALALLAWEYAMLCGLSVVQRAMYVAAVIALFAAAILPWRLADALYQLLLMGGVLLWLASPAWLATRAVLPSALKLLLGFFVVAGAGVALHALKEVAIDGRWVLMAFVIVWAADIGGYAVGRVLGQHKLAPRISPGKTWEGFAGGVAFVLLAGLVAAPWLVSAGNAPYWYALLLVVAVMSVVGDLVESLLKRQAGVKDSGRLLPGHGGLLDRLDSLLAVAPVFFIIGTQIGIFGELSGIGR